MLHNIFLKREVFRWFGLLFLLSQGMVLAKPESPAAEPAPMEISEELLSDFEEDVQAETPGKTTRRTDSQTTPEGNIEAKTRSKTSGEPKTQTQTAPAEASVVFKPLRVGEVEIPLAQKAAAPILPVEYLARKMGEYNIPIVRSDKPGFTLESEHFLIEADSYWMGREADLVKIALLAEETRLESELVASLWRKPLFRSSNPRNLNAPLIPSRDLKFRAGSLKPEIFGERIHMRIVDPENSPAHASGCQLAFLENELVFVISAENIREFTGQAMRQGLRREIFNTMLHDGQENRIFPQWLQNGLADVFAGQEARPTRGNGKLLFQLSKLVDSPDDERGQTAVSVVRYCLTSNDGKVFFPFWDQLAQIYSSGRQSLGELGGTRLLSALDAKTRENQSNSEEILELFFNEIESDARNESFANWQKSMASVSGGDSVRVFWVPEAQVLNGETSDSQLPRVGLDESWKAVFLEMARILKLTGRSQAQNVPNVPNVQNVQNSPVEAISVTQTHGVKIQEFGKDPTENSSAKPQEAPKEDSQTATAEDLQKLEMVLAWLKKNPQRAFTLNPDGSIMCEYFMPGQLDKMFHPRDRNYLLQEYEGNLVLSATFRDGYVLHVIMEKSSQAQGVPEIRILGVEKPEKSEKTENQK